MNRRGPSPCVAGTLDANRCNQSRGGRRLLSGYGLGNQFATIELYDSCSGDVIRRSLISRSGGRTYYANIARVSSVILKSRTSPARGCAVCRFTATACLPVPNYKRSLDRERSIASFSKRNETTPSSNQTKRSPDEDKIIRRTKRGRNTDDVYLLTSNKARTKIRNGGAIRRRK